jgi:hypothetical protein
MTTTSRLAVTLLSACSLLVVPRTAAAQNRAGIEQKAWVTTTDGQELQGKMTSFTDAGVLLREKGGQTRTIALRDVARIDVPDGLGNGTRNGAIGGSVLAGLLVLSIASFCDRDCGGEAVGMAVAGSAIYIGAGAGIGALIDAARVKRQTLYVRSSSASAVRITPMLGPHAAGIQFSLQWPRR